jgi:hypothetical protein
MASRQDDIKGFQGAHSTGLSQSSEEHEMYDIGDKRPSVIETGIPTYLEEDDHFGEANVVQSAAGKQSCCLSGQDRI